MDNIGYVKVRTCLDRSGLHNCTVTNPANQIGAGKIKDVSIMLTPGVDPASVMAALRDAGLLYSRGPMNAGFPDRSSPSLDLRCGVGSYLLFVDMN